METIAFISQKGGVGKTTSTANIGSGLAILGKRVLLIDLDPQSHLALSLGVSVNDLRYTIYDVLRGDAEMSEAFVRRDLGAKINRLRGGDGQSPEPQEERLFMTIVPSNLNLSAMDMEFSGVPRKEYLLKEALQTVNEDFDYALIDCPPGLGLLTVNALAAARYVTIPVQTEYLALESLGKLMGAIEVVKQDLNKSLEVGGIIATRFDGRKVLNKDVVSQLYEQFGGLLFESVIRENIALAEAPKRGVDIFTYRPSSYGAMDYLRLCEEVIERNRRRIGQELVS